MHMYHTNGSCSTENYYAGIIHRDIISACIGIPKWVQLGPGGVLKRLKKPPPFAHRWHSYSITLSTLPPPSIMTTPRTYYTHSAEEAYVHVPVLVTAGFDRTKRIYRLTSIPQRQNRESIRKYNMATKRRGNIFLFEICGPILLTV